MLSQRFSLWLFFILYALISSGHAYEVSDRLHAQLLSSGAWQCQGLTSYPLSEGDKANLCRGGYVLQPELIYDLSSRDRFDLKLGFASGNGLNEVTPFVLEPWNADLSDVVRHINGGNRSYLLTLWYQHEFRFSSSHSLKATAGIIDATDYFITNRYSNDVYSQFMSGPLSFGQNFIVPSYDYGGVLIWQFHGFKLTSLMMNVAKNDDYNNFNYYAMQIEISNNSQIGEGHYRFMIDASDNKFISANGQGLTKRTVAMFSLDQALGQILGVWVRCAWDRRQTQLQYSAIYTGGLNLSGKRWGRPGDHLAVGVAYMNNGTLSLKNAYVIEAYYRWALFPFLSISPDLQFQSNRFSLANKQLSGFVYGLRFTFNA